ncbi:MAG: Type 1 glutamine amidotransferase-like domain-containing protein [Ignavibacteria bacterium]|nr:Type 1 glutamine amidotransferase-like domain-containing protein [Ignavibacteria bacterium]
MTYRILVLLFILFNQIILPQGYICAVGGGSENYNSWSDAPYRWIVEKSDSGKIIILSYSTDNTSWLPNYFLSLGASEAYNKAITSKTIADLQSTYDELKTAKAVFLRGGDQLRYINYWKGTKTEQAITELYNEGKVIAGTSAGAMVLGNFDFSARYGSITSKTALSDPLSNALDIEKNFINLQPNLLFDTHFIERGRFGRLISMIIKLKHESNVDLLGVGIDDATALCIEPNGIATVMGSGAVSFFYSDSLTSYFASTFDSEYGISQLKCDQLTANWKFNIPSRTIEYIPPSARHIEQQNQPRTVNNNILSNSSNSFSNLINSFYTLLSNSNGYKSVLLTHPGYVLKLDSLLTYLNNSSLPYELIPVSSTTINDSMFSQKLLEASIVMILGDSTSKLEALTDTSNLLGATLKNKIEDVQLTSFLFFNQAVKMQGEFYVDNTDSDALASYRGKMTLKKGLGIVKSSIIQVNPFESDDYIENRVSALLWGMMRNNSLYGVYSNPYDNYFYQVLTEGLSTLYDNLLLAIDATGTTYVDSSVFRASSSIGPRQVVAMNNLRYNITSSNGVYYSFPMKQLAIYPNVKSEPTEVPNTLSLTNYPNPFNSSTKLNFYLPSDGEVNVVIYDLLGRSKKIINSVFYKSGTHEIELDFNSEKNFFSSGIYFVKIDLKKKLTSQILTGMKKVIYLK